jgi:hypothetical protein
MSRRPKRRTKPTPKASIQQQAQQQIRAARRQKARQSKYAEVKKKHAKPPFQSRGHTKLNSTNYCAQLLSDPNVISYEDKMDHLESGIAKFLNFNGLILEFGVAGGTTLRKISNSVSKYFTSDSRQQAIHGFDTFEGLTESWRDGFEKGAFDMDGMMPIIPNVTMHKGAFQTQLPEFLKSHPEQVSFLHIDSDLYSSASFVLNTLFSSNRIVSGTIIAFDELCNFDGWQQHEHKAWLEAVQNYNVSFRWLSRVVGGDQQQAMLIVMSLPRIHNAEIVE